MAKKYYLDMDGVLAKWDDFEIPVDEMQQPGFFRNLEPCTHMVDAVKELIRDGEDVNILSAVFNQAGIEEKQEWLDEQLPEIPREKRIFTRCGEDKCQVLEGMENRRDAVLIDDYSKNLLAWQEAGGTGIKFMNSLNAVQGKWTGDFLFWRTDPRQLATTIEAIAHKDELQQLRQKEMERTAEQPVKSWEPAKDRDDKKKSKEKAFTR